MRFVTRQAFAAGHDIVGMRHGVAKPDVEVARQAKISAPGHEKRFVGRAVRVMAVRAFPFNERGMMRPSVTFFDGDVIMARQAELIGLRMQE
jgi:hypothetical protein